MKIIETPQLVPTEIDANLARDRAAEKAQKAAEARAPLYKAAMWRALHNRERVREALRTNAGVWWPELAPLTPHERTAVIVELRRIFGLPYDARMRPAEGAATKLDVPDLARPE